MFEQTFKNIDDILHKDAGCSSELDYVEQTSWVLFLKYLDDLEKDKATAASLTGKAYKNILSPEYQWAKWAMPKDKAGKLDHHRALTGDDLKDFVDHKLFPYLRKFKTIAESPDTIEYKIGEIFIELKNKIQSGYNLREVINRIDELRFRTHAEKHEMSHLYEDKIKNMGNAGRNGGEYYTPRPLIKTIVKVVAPKIGDKIYDGAVGSAGFLCESFEYLRHSKGKPENLTSKDIETLQKKTFYGKEKKSLAYIIGIMNMILHGIEAPNIIHTNTLAENLADIQEKDRYNIVLANPPFGGKERAEVQQNFPIKSSETAYLFLEHFIKILKAGGKAGIVIKNTFLSNTDNASVSLRKMLLDSCNLYTILDLPGGTFTGAGVKTVVLFFEKGKPTQKVWFYQMNLDRNLGKTNPLNENDLAEFVELQKTYADSENSWTVNLKDVDQSMFDLSVKNPNKKDEVALRKPQEILEEMKVLDEESTVILNSSYLHGVFEKKGDEWEVKVLKEVCELKSGTTISTNLERTEGDVLYVKVGDMTLPNNEVEINTSSRFVNSEEIKTNQIIPIGAVIFPKRGGAIATNKKRKIIKPTIVDLNIMAIIPGNKIDADYFFHWFHLIDLNSISNGTSIPQINYYSFDEVKISFPKSKEEQQSIVRHLDALRAETQKLKAIYQKKLVDLAELQKTIFQKALAGELKIENALSL